MKIKYEVGDEVFHKDNYGGQRFKIVRISLRGFLCENDYGERVFLGKKSVEPTPGTLERAKVVAS